MSPDQVALARRALACRGWRWLPGMVVRRWSDYDVVWRTQRVAKRLAEGWIPDLSDPADPATLGCLLALVREAWGNPRLTAVYCEPANPGQSEGWAVQAADNRMPVAGENYATEAEALVAALEAAP